MAERKAVNKYYPPDWTPDQGSLNTYHGTHALRERARKLGQGILIIRFELPYNIWCGGCGNHVGMGVRYNAEKKKVGNYYSTPIYRFRMKCHLCDNHFEIETDPKNCEYVVVSGARRKEERWEPSATETIETTDREDAKKLAEDAMFKLEHGVQDVKKSKAAAPALEHLKEIQSVWKDDYAANQILRKKFREEKKELKFEETKDEELKAKGALDVELVPERAEDIDLAKRIRYKNEGFDGYRRKRRLEIKSRPLFDSKDKSSNQKSNLTELLQKRRMIELTASSQNQSKSESEIVNKFGVISRRKRTKVERVSSGEEKQLELCENTRDSEATKSSATELSRDLRSTSRECHVSDQTNRPDITAFDVTPDSGHTVKSCQSTVQNSNEVSHNREHDSGVAGTGTPGLRSLVLCEYTDSGESSGEQ